MVAADRTLFDDRLQARAAIQKPSKPKLTANPSAQIICFVTCYIAEQYPLNSLFKNVSDNGPSNRPHVPSHVPIFCAMQTGVCILGMSWSADWLLRSFWALGF
jgi:hypothetical protein